MRQMEEKIQFLTKNLHDLQSTLRTLNDRFQQGVLRPGGGGGSASGGGGGGSTGGRNLADAAQPEIKETINSIKTKLDQLDNRTQASCYVLTCCSALCGWDQRPDNQCLLSIRLTTRRW